MTSLDSFLKTIAEQPHDNDQWLILADFLEDQNDPRAELVRLLYALRHPEAIVADRRTKAYRQRKAREARLRQLLESGVTTCQPRRINSLGMEFVLIPPGVFLMGGHPGEEGRRSDETQRRVTLTQGFFLGVHQVTQEQWRTVMGDNPGYFKGDNLPVDSVSWEDCQEFCKRLGQTDGQRYRLPTEAEWEYGCRGGTSTPFYFGETISTDQANYDGNYTYGKEGKKGVHRGTTTRVGSFPANAWGLFDMHGNIHEWCQDRFGPYSLTDITDPQGRETESVRIPFRVVRGGAWVSNPPGCRSAYRYGLPPAVRGGGLGCRVVLCLD